MRPLSFDHPRRGRGPNWSAKGSIFGVRTDQFWRPATGRWMTNSFGDRLANPVGPPPARRPSCRTTSSSPIAGARFMERRRSRRWTVRIRHAVAAVHPGRGRGLQPRVVHRADRPGGLRRVRPGLLALAVFAKELGLGTIEDVAYNMSVGCDLEGHQGREGRDPPAGAWPTPGRPTSGRSATRGSSSTSATSRASPRGPRVAQPHPQRLGHPLDPARLSRRRDRAHRVIPPAREGAQHLRQVQSHPLGMPEPAPRWTGSASTMSPSDDHHFTADLQYADAVAMLAGCVNRPVAWGWPSGSS